MAEIKFYQDSQKQVQVYPEINPDGNYPGVTVGLADNLASTSGIDNRDTWQFRSSGGEADLSNGYASLVRLIGTTESGTIPESLIYTLNTQGVEAISITASTFKSQISAGDTYHFIYTPIMTSEGVSIYLASDTFAIAVGQQTGDYVFTYTANVSKTDPGDLVSSFTKSTFVSKVGGVPGDYVFVYNGANWQLDGTNVTLSQYGITVSGTPESEDSFTINYNSNDWVYDESVVSLGNYGITVQGTPAVGNTITIHYTKNQWNLTGASTGTSVTDVTLATYGISITTGSPFINDDIQIVYVPEQMGAIKISKPTALHSVGLNQFNVDGNQILRNYTINSSGVITAETGKFVVYFKCIEETYTIYNENANSIIRVAYKASVPQVGDTLTILNPVTSSEWGTYTNDTTHTHVTTSNEGYLCVAVSDIDDLCCHLSWEGEYEDVWESYWEQDLIVPYTADNFSREYGLVNLDNSTTYYDEINFEDGKWYERTGRLPYSTANMTTVQAMGTPYLYNSSYIYYGLLNPITHNLTEMSSEYKIDNYGTEELLDTQKMPCDVTILYQDNLKDKLRFSVEVIDNKVQKIEKNSTQLQYPSAAASYNLVLALKAILGLDINTFSTTNTYEVGDYVVYEGKLYKCTTAISTAGAWTGAVGQITSDVNNVLVDFNYNKFISYKSSAWSGQTYVLFIVECAGANSFYVRPSGGASSTWKHFNSKEEMYQATGILATDNIGTAEINITAGGNWTESYIFQV